MAAPSNAMAFIAASTGILEFLRTHLSTLSPLVRFVVGMSAIFITPSLSRRLKLPPVVGLLVAGIILGPTCSTFSAKNAR